MSATTHPSLSLGPVLYLWDGPKWRDFYFRIADEAPVDHVTLGEAVCSKRLHFIEPHVAEVIERLEGAGKKVSLASLALVTLERESQLVRGLVRDSIHPIEANDLSALGLLAGKPHSIGPLINVYNGATARLLASRGATSICLPPELPMASVRDIVRDAPDVEFEIFGFGRVPLAISARCAHARSKGLVKDNCQFICGEDSDGLIVETLDRQPFLTLNGVQTLSHTCQSLLQELAELAAVGVSRIRLSPQDCDMVTVARIYEDVATGRISATEGLERLAIAYPGVPLSNGFHHGRSGASWISAPTASP
ncbi:MULTISPECIES: U32 family peptidase [Ensifer]|jgi:O2-independent ubiquinone biosynthesis protein UbiV|uniref:Ubiquinone biosynthesis protein UbiV n=1 Tax=Ensifer canadensis TaxID=555315 RepID=A0AAW4FHT6_9HYPH|nr:MULTISPECIES: U32 family peptidase [Ensifer]KQW50244.1 protease [Ensifer sp. Root1252]KRC74468.1 protease [Ensifer sp. Root231]KRD03181.1 protease [Ensifer sp. Root258]MBM3090576.1 U32 family peptidase [Ensifer canadensis]UBI80798.1 U32 family peptidase [Ensifer canadensis]